MKSNIKLYGIQSKDIDKIWGHAVLLLEKAMKYTYGKFKVYDVYTAIKEKEMQLWLMGNENEIKACVVTQIVIYPRKKVLMMVFAAGQDCRGWVHFIEDYKKYAKENGCDSIEIFGRPGWGKVMKHLGIQEIHTVFKFDVT